MTMQTISSAQIRPDLGMPYEEIDPIAAAAGYVFSLLFPMMEQVLHAGSFAKIKVDAKMPKVSLSQLRRGPGGEYGRTFWQYVSDSFETADYGVEELVDRRQAGIMAIHGIQAYQQATDRSVGLMLRAMEQWVADHVADDTTYASQYAAGSAWDTPGGTPIRDVSNLILTFQERTGVSPNLLHVPIELARHALLTSEVSNLNYRPVGGSIGDFLPGPMMAEKLSAIFGIRVAVSEGVANTADAGLTASLARIHDQTKVQALCVNAGDLKAGPSFGRRIVWSGEGGSGGGVLVEQYPEPKKRSDVVCARSDFEFKVVDSRLIQGLSGLAS